MRSVILRSVLGCVLGLWFVCGAAVAGPWAEVGDAQMRSDIEILAAAGVIDNITMQWPLPWGGILDRLNQPGALDGQPDYVVDAAFRIRQRGMAQSEAHRLHAAVTVDGTNGPDVVRAFDALGRQDVQGQATLEYLSNSTAVHLALGAQRTDRIDRQLLVPDGSYIAQRIGNVAVKAGYLTHWWGPGWFSALTLSNNARPMPQIQISRIDTAPFESSWLSWLGPWQAEFFVGVLDGPRVARNTIYDGFRFGFSPLPHLEIGLSRTDQMCGTGHPCKPLVGYFNLDNEQGAPNIVNDEGGIDIHYSGAFAGWAYEIYAQAMNEDSDPFIHSGTSHVFGASAWVPFKHGTGRLTVEYADSLATSDLWGGSVTHGVAYNNYDYVDGMRYRGRTLGFSLDSDSRLLSAQVTFTDRLGHSFGFTYHRANISDPLNALGNVVTTAPVTINLVEVRADLPFRLRNRVILLNLVGRLQDDRPRPDKGFLAAAEASLTIPL